jgi:O-antigen ligase
MSYSSPKVSLLSALSGPSDTIDGANFSTRLQQYIAAVDIGFQYPLFGIGGMNFPLVAESYGLPDPIEIHNIYLSVLASTGIPGAVLFLLSISAVLVIAGKKALSTENDRLFWAMLVCGILGFHAYSFWVTIHAGGVAYLVFWVLAGAVVGASHQQGTNATGRSDAA